jgi:hypothetical protein
VFLTITRIRESVCERTIQHCARKYVLARDVGQDSKSQSKIESLREELAECIYNGLGIIDGTVLSTLPPSKRCTIVPVKELQIFYNQRLTCMYGAFLMLDHAI